MSSAIEVRTHAHHARQCTDADTPALPGIFRTIASIIGVAARLVAHTPRMGTRVIHELLATPSRRRAMFAFVGGAYVYQHHTAEGVIMMRRLQQGEHIAADSVITSTACYVDPGESLKRDVHRGYAGRFSPILHKHVRTDVPLAMCTAFLAGVGYDTFAMQWLAVTSFALQPENVASHASLYGAYLRVIEDDDLRNDVTQAASALASATPTMASALALASAVVGDDDDNDDDAGPNTNTYSYWWTGGGGGSSGHRAVPDRDFHGSRCDTPSVIEYLRNSDKLSSDEQIEAKSILVRHARESDIALYQRRTNHLFARDHELLMQRYKSLDWRACESLEWTSPLYTLTAFVAWLSRVEMPWLPAHQYETESARQHAIDLGVSIYGVPGRSMRAFTSLINDGISSYTRAQVFGLGAGVMAGDVRMTVVFGFLSVYLEPLLTSPYIAHTGIGVGLVGFLLAIIRWSSRRTTTTTTHNNRSLDARMRELVPIHTDDKVDDDQHLDVLYSHVVPALNWLRTEQLQLRSADNSGNATDNDDNHHRDAHVLSLSPSSSSSSSSSSSPAVVIERMNTHAKALYADARQACMAKQTDSLIGDMAGSLFVAFTHHAMQATSAFFRTTKSYASAPLDAEDIDTDDDNDDDDGDDDGDNDDSEVAIARMHPLDAIAMLCM